MSRNALGQRVLSDAEVQRRFSQLVVQMYARPRLFTYIDLFCGAGGSSVGLTMAGGRLLLAANHCERNIETHSTNFPESEHLCADINHYDMRFLPRGADVLWASPICTEVSPAGGSAHQVVVDDDEDEPAADKGVYERTRATAHDVIRAAEVHHFPIILVENVVEFATKWELFDWWLEAFTKHLRPGYNVQIVCVSSAHVGGEENPQAPQWRDRLYVVFTRKDLPVPDMAPRPRALCTECGVDVDGVQTWKDPFGRKIGKYRQQYVYTCPQCTAVVEPYVRAAASVIDWSQLGTRIGDRKRPLAESTRRRIERGIEMFGRSATLLPVGGSWNTEPTTPEHPFRTRTSREWEALFTPPGVFIDVQRNNGRLAPVTDPLTTVAAGGNHHALVSTPPGAFYIKNYGSVAEAKYRAKPMTEPLGAITTSDSHGLVVPYYRTGVASSTTDPMHTLTVRDRFGLVTGLDEIDVDDCFYRMIQPLEQARAQRFPDIYEITGNKTEQTKQVGNAVSCNVAQWIVERAITVLGVRS